MTLLTKSQHNRLVDYLNTHTLSSGIGNKESACSIAAINLAISGELTDDIPSCMSNVLGHTTIKLQDSMPSVMRNSVRYKRLLPDMVGTGRDREGERLSVLLDWMWTKVLPQLQPVADESGFGEEWKKMCRHKDADAARAATDAACAAADAWDADRAAYAADAARAAAYAADVARADAVDAARAAADAARAAARAVIRAAVCVGKDFWENTDTIDLLERMTYLETKG